MAVSPIELITLMGRQGLDPAALALFGRMTSPPAGAQALAYSNFFATPGIKAIIAKHDSLWLTMGGDEQANLLDLTSRHNATKTGAVLSMPWRGMFTDGTTGSLSLGAFMNALTHYAQNSACTWAFITETKETSSNFRNVLGQASASTLRMRLSPHDGLGNVFGQINDATQFSGVVNGGILTGLFNINRSGASARSFRRGGVVLGSDSQASSSLSAQEIVAFRGGATYCSNGALVGAIGVCESLTDAEAGTLETAIATLYAALRPTPISSGVTSATFVSSTTVPDGQGSFAGKGFTCTGLCDDTADGTSWLGNFGRKSDQDAPTNTPSLVHTSGDFVTKLAEFDLSAYSTADGPQGVCVNPIDNVVACVFATSALVRWFDKSAGGLIGSFNVGYNCNALAWDSTNSCYIVGRAATAAAPNIVEWRSTSGTLLAWVEAPNNADHFWFDASKNHLWMSYGNNGVDGKVDIFDLNSRTVVKTLTLVGTLAPEGITKRGSTLFIADDARYHIGSSSVNAVRAYALA